MSEITALLHRTKSGDKQAEEELITALYGELRRLAGALLRSNRRDHTLQPTALVNEAYLKLMRGQQVSWQDRVHFFAVAARAMRQILVDHARRAMAGKRGGGVEMVTLEKGMPFERAKPVELLAVNQALDRLAEKDPRVHSVVELRFFGGLSVEEAAEVMGISTRTVRREWSLGRAWLLGELGEQAKGAGAQG